MACWDVLALEMFVAFSRQCDAFFGCCNRTQPGCIDQFLSRALHFGLSEVCLGLTTTDLSNRLPLWRADSYRSSRMVSEAFPALLQASPWIIWCRKISLSRDRGVGHDHDQNINVAIKSADVGLSRVICLSRGAVHAETVMLCDR